MKAPALLRRFLAFLLLCTLAGPLHARGGGGCLERGTLVDTPAGPVAVEQLRACDTVWGLVSGHRAPATVQAVLQVEPAHYIELTADGVVLRVTPEHPMEVAPGVFVRADHLAAGATVNLAPVSAAAPLPAVALASVRVVAATTPAYNLLVSPGGVFFANGFAVHNKGCFLPDTPVTMADGSRRAISEVHEGDAVLAFTADGTIVRTAVRHILTHEVSSYLILRTPGVELHVTEEHPFYVGNGTFRTAEALHAGDTVYAYDGHGLVPQPILALEHIRAPVTVYNLQTGEPHTFLADGIAVHNKGGGGGGSFGGGHSYYSSGGSSNLQYEMNPLAFIFVLILIALVVGVVLSQQNSQSEDLDFCFGRGEIDAKARKTLELLRFIAQVDAAWAPETLSARVREIFIELQFCWSERAYAPMEPLMMRDLYQQHCAQLEGLRQTHEINKIAQLTVDAVDLVQVNYTDKKEHRTFTALITATARDYYVDDRFDTFLRGDEEPAQFQEFWTFQWIDGAFLLREIEQTKESDALTEENFFEQFTDAGRDQIYGDTAGPGGPAGPALPGEVLAKEQKITRLLNFLVQTDKIWDRDTMLATARRVYLQVLLAFQDGHAEKLTGLEATPEMAAHLRDVVTTNLSNGLRVEHRNLCVRKVEIVLVNNRDDRSLDTFTARISSHAQTIITRGATEVRHDEYVQVTVEFWTFGRDGARWVLQEIQPAAAGEAAIARENVDEGSSAQMLEWYYSKPRAT